LATDVISLQERKLQREHREVDPESFVRVVDDPSEGYYIEIGPESISLRVPGTWADEGYALWYARQIAATLNYVISQAPSVPEPKVVRRG